MTKIPAGHCLIQQISDYVAQADVSRPLHVVLPTQRLVTWLTRELALSQGGAAILPYLWTWDQFCRELVQHQTTETSVMVSEQCELIMTEILKTLPDDPLFNTGLLSPRHAHELLYLDSQLERAGLRHSARQSLLDWVDRDWHRTDEVRAAIANRIECVFKAIELFQSRLAGLNRQTESAARTRPLEALIADSGLLQSVAPKGQIVIAGLTSLPQTEIKLLAALGDLEGVEIWVDEPAVDNPRSPLAQIYKHLGQSWSRPAGDFLWARGVTAIDEHETILDEIFAAVAWANDQLTKGIPPHEIAIIVPDEASYGPVLAEAASLVRSAVNIPLPVSWDQSQAGAWLRILRDCLQDPRPDHLCQFLVHPVTAQITAANLKDTLSPGPDTLARIQLNLQDAPVMTSRASQDMKRAAYFEFFKKHASPRVHNWLDAVATLLRTGGFDARAQTFEVDHFVSLIVVMAESDEASRGPGKTDLWAPLFQAARLVDEIKDLIGLRQNPGFAPWLAAVYACASRATSNAVGEPLFDAQIIGLTEARYLPFQSVLIVGCMEGYFPHALPKDSLIDNAMRKVMGLPGWQDLESLEDTTFSLLTGRLHNVALSYARTDSGQITTRSRWIERLANRIPVTKNTGAWERVVSPAGMALSESSGDLEGRCPDPGSMFETISASSLERLIQCPYQYLLSKHRLSEVQTPEDVEDRAVGSLLHRIAEQFFRADLDARLGPDLLLANHPENPADYETWALERLQKITILTCSDAQLRSPKTQQMVGRGWAKIAGIFAKIYQAGFSPTHVVTERKIKKEDQIRLALGDFSPVVEGSMDVVFVDGDRTLLIDYKSSSPPGRALFNQGRAPQLPLYMWAMGPEKLGGETAAGYISFTNGTIDIYAASEAMTTAFASAGLIGARTKPKTPTDVWADVLGLAESRVTEIKNLGRFKADAQDCEYCPFKTVCKVDDPRHKDRIAAQSSAGREPGEELPLTAAGSDTL